jgi:hypothetical protein
VLGAKDKLSREIRQCLLDACENVGERIAQRDAEALKAAGREIDLNATRRLKKSRLACANWVWSRGGFIRS